MAGTIRELFVKIGADTKDFTGGIASSLTSLTGLSSGALAAGGIIGGAFAAIGAAAFAVGQDWEEAAGTIRAGTGATGQDLENLKTSAQNVFTGVPEDAQKVSSALADLNTNLGLTGAPLERMTTQFLNLERLPLGFGGNVQDLTRVFGDWGIATNAQSSALDFLAVTAQTTGAGVDELAQNVVQFGAPLRQLGFNFEESAALMGKFQTEGVNLETVMSGMRIGLANLAKSGREPAAALQETIAEIQNAGTQSEANTVAIEIFGQRAGPDMAAAIREGRFEIDELVKKLQESPDSINKMAEDSKTLGERWSELTNNLSLLLEPLGTDLVKAAGAATEALTKLFKVQRPTIDNSRELDKATETLADRVLKAAKDQDEYVRSGQRVLPLTKDLAENSKQFRDRIEKLAVEFGVLSPKVEQVAEDSEKLAEQQAAAEEAARKLKEEAKKLEDQFKKGLAAATEELRTDTFKTTDSINFLNESLETVREGYERGLVPIERLDDAVEAHEERVTALIGKLDELSTIGLRDWAEANRDLQPTIQAVRSDTQMASDQAIVLAEIMRVEMPAGATQANAAMSELATAMGAFNIQTTADKQKQAEDLRGKLDQLKLAAEQGEISWDDYNAAVDQYNTKIGAAKEPTGLFHGALTQVSTVITDLGDNLVGSFSTALNTGIGPIDDFKDAVLRLVSEQVLGKLSGLLGGLIDKIPGLNRLGSALGGLGGGAASSAGGAAGQAAGGVGGGGGLGGGLGGAAAMANPVTGIITAAAGVFDAVFGGIQRGQMNEKLTLIEENTRTLSFRAEGGGIQGVLIQLKEELMYGFNTKANEKIRDLINDEGVNAWRDLRGHLPIQTTVLEQLRDKQLVGHGLVDSQTARLEARLDRLIDGVDRLRDALSLSVSIDGRQVAAAISGPLSRQSAFA